MVDGPRDGDGEITSPQTLWVGTRGGVHQFDLVVGPSNPLGAFSYDRMINEDEFTANNIQSILPLGDEVIVGSQWGDLGPLMRTMFVLLESNLITHESRGRVVDMTVLEVDGCPSSSPP